MPTCTHTLLSSSSDPTPTPLLTPQTTGKVVRGPAPLSLALAHVTINEGKVLFTPWTEQDFRTGLAPWWK